MNPLDCLPHRPPLRVIERLDALEARRAAASFVVQEGPLTRGGALWSGALIEGLAQTAALLGAGMAGAGQPTPIRGLLVGLRGLELGRSPRVGERVSCEVSLVTRLGGGVLVAGCAHVGPEEVARGRLQFVMEPVS